MGQKKLAVWREMKSAKVSNYDGDQCWACATFFSSRHSDVPHFINHCATAPPLRFFGKKFRAIALAPLNPLTTKNEKFADFRSLFLVVRWVQNFSNFWDISIHSKEMRNFHFPVFLTVHAYLKIYFQENFSCWFQIRWNFKVISNRLGDMNEIILFF